MFTGADFIKGYKIVDIGDETIKCRTLSDAVQLKWFFECSGHLRTLTYVGFHSRFLHRIRSLWQFSNSIYKVSASQQVTARDMLHALEGADDKWDDLSNVADFREFLEALPPNEILTPDVVSRLFGESGEEISLPHV